MEPRLVSKKCPNYPNEIAHLPEIIGFDFTVLLECSAKDNLAQQCQEKMGLDKISRKVTSFLDALILSAMPPRLSQWPRSFVWLRAFKGKLLELSFEKNVCLLVELKPKKARIEVWRKQKKVFLQNSNFRYQKLFKLHKFYQTGARFFIFTFNWMRLSCLGWSAELFLSS